MYGKNSTFTQCMLHVDLLDREKINIYFSGATFQVCLHKNNTLKFVLH